MTLRPALLASASIPFLDWHPLPWGLDGLEYVIVAPPEMQVRIVPSNPVRWIGIELSRAWRST